MMLGGGLFMGLGVLLMLAIVFLPIGAVAALVAVLLKKKS